MNPNGPNMPDLMDEITRLRARHGSDEECLKAAIYRIAQLESALHVIVSIWNDPGPMGMTKSINRANDLLKRG